MVVSILSVCGYASCVYGSLCAHHSLTSSITPSPLHSITPSSLTPSLPHSIIPSLPHSRLPHSHSLPPSHTQPFWPTGTGCSRGFLSAMDTAWLIRGLGQKRKMLDLLRERESIFQLLPQTIPEKLHANIKAYTIDPQVEMSLQSATMQRLNL